MAHENPELESVRRHMGVALIDLTYVEAELRHCARELNGLAGEQCRIASDILADELFRLRKFSDRMHEIGRTSSDGLSLSDLSRWWPTEIRRRASRAD